MTGTTDAWTLPGLTAWAGKVAARLDTGLALVSEDAVAPPGLEDAVLRNADRLISSLADCSAGTPADALASLFGEQPTLEDLLSDTLDGQCAVVRFAEIPDKESRDRWEIFLARFARGRKERGRGLAIFVPDLPVGVSIAGSEPVENWRKSLRRGDKVIWAEEHIPRTRNEVAEELAVALATGLCRWRLDLAAELGRASVRDLSNPLEWLKGRAEHPVADEEKDADERDRCPLALLKDGNEEAIQERVWRAHLVSLFPLIEEERQDFIAKYRDLLRIDKNQESLKVKSVDEMALGAIDWQLGRKLKWEEAARLKALAQVRNSLAHRKPGLPGDVRIIISGSVRSEW